MLVMSLHPPPKRLQWRKNLTWSHLHSPLLLVKCFLTLAMNSLISSSAHAPLPGVYWCHLIFLDSYFCLAGPLSPFPSHGAPTSNRLDKSVPARDRSRVPVSCNRWDGIPHSKPQRATFPEPRHWLLGRLEKYILYNHNPRLEILTLFAQ